MVSTIVRFNNWLGRLYFLPVRPIHRLIVPAMLRNGLRWYVEALSTGERTLVPRLPDGGRWSRRLSSIVKSGSRLW